MLKHTPKLLVSKASTLPTKLGGSKKRWLLNQYQINLGKENYYIARDAELIPFLYYSQGYLRLLPNQLMEQQNSFIECMWMLTGNGCFGTFCTLGYCLVQKKVSNELISPN